MPPPSSIVLFVLPTTNNMIVSTFCLIKLTVVVFALQSYNRLPQWIFQSSSETMREPCQTGRRSISKKTQV